MLAVSKAHYLQPHRPAGFVRCGAGVHGMVQAHDHDRHIKPERPSGEPPPAVALLAHLAGLALGAALIMGATTVAALGLSLALS